MGACWYIEVIEWIVWLKSRHSEHFMLKLYKRLYKERTPARTRKLAGKISFLSERVHIQGCNKQQWVGQIFHSYGQIFHGNRGNISWKSGKYFTQYSPVGRLLRYWWVLEFQRCGPCTTILIKLGAPCHFFSPALSHLRKRFFQVYFPPKAFKWFTIWISSYGHLLVVKMFC